jgi:hypothetical protein
LVFFGYAAFFGATGFLTAFGALGAGFDLAGDLEASFLTGVSAGAGLLYSSLIGTSSAAGFATTLAAFSVDLALCL